MIAVSLLVACSGGASTETPSYVGKIFIGGGYVEGLDYEIKTDSGMVKTGTTGAGGTFDYQTNDTVTFKLGNAFFPAYKLNASGTRKLTHFDIFSTRDPNALVIQNISVLLNFLDDDYPSQNYLAKGIKINADKRTIAAQVFQQYPNSDTADGALQALNDDKFLEVLTVKANGSAYSVPNVADVLARSRTILNNPASRIEIAPVAVGTGTYNDFNKTITLSASDSYDANSDNLTYAWTLLNRPRGSAATLVTPTASTATAVADVVSAEPYVFQLTVKDATNLPSAAQVTVYVQGLSVSPTIKSSSVYMAGALVEGLPYSTGKPTPCPGDAALVPQTNCVTGPKGLFNYQSGDTVTFKLGSAPTSPILGSYAIKLDAPSPLTLFDIVGNTNPNATPIKNISVLLHALDDNQNISNDIKINQQSLRTAAAVTDALTAESYLTSLTTSMNKVGVAVPSSEAVMALATTDMKSDGIPIAPYANASASFNPFNNVITLSGAGSADANSDDLKYSWTLVSKPKSSSAVIATPSLISASLVADDLSEPYVLRLTVTDTTAPTPLTNASLVTVNVGQASVTGVYANPLSPPNPANENPSTLLVSPTYARQVVAVTDSQELWGYTYYTDKLPRKFSGPIARSAINPTNFTVTPLSFQTNQLCTLFVGTDGVKGCDTQMDMALNVTNPNAVNGRQLNVNRDWAKQFLFATGTLNAGQLTSVTAANAPALQIASYVGIYREKSETGDPPYKDWKITAKGEFNFYKTLADGKLTLCALGQFDLDNTGQVLSKQRLVTRNALPVTLEFKNECDENFDVGTFTTGYLFADPTLGIAGFTFIGKNISGSKFTLKHFKRE